jgi:hypothetical protein
MRDIAPFKKISLVVLAGEMSSAVPPNLAWVFQKVDAAGVSLYDARVMTTIAKKLDAKLNQWAPETAKKVEQLVAEIIELADYDALDLVRSRKVEQEVLDIIDGRKAG